mmetsp:Transcript_30424/g.87193  ORF Transcript_30424/g.87193 Transcript_30424/m.87193 type:complete len:263 (+) Transcript_30424:2509-3297(+)
MLPSKGFAAALQVIADLAACQKQSPRFALQFNLPLLDHTFSRNCGVPCDPRLGGPVDGGHLPVAAADLSDGEVPAASGAEAAKCHQVERLVRALGTADDQGRLVRQLRPTTALALVAGLHVQGPRRHPRPNDDQRHVFGHAVGCQNVQPKHSEGLLLIKLQAQAPHLRLQFPNRGGGHVWSQAHGDTGTEAKLTIVLGVHGAGHGRDQQLVLLAAHGREADDVLLRRREEVEAGGDPRNRRPEGHADGALGNDTPTAVDAQG